MAGKWQTCQIGLVGSIRKNFIGWILLKRTLMIVNWLVYDSFGTRLIRGPCEFRNSKNRLRNAATPSGQLTVLYSVLYTLVDVHTELLFTKNCSVCTQSSRSWRASICFLQDQKHVKIKPIESVLSLLCECLAAWWLDYCLAIVLTETFRWTLFGEKRFNERKDDQSEILTPNALDKKTVLLLLL